MLGITQRDAAASLKITVTTLLNWELGKRQPRIQYIPAVVEFLGYDPLPQPQAIPERLRQKRRRMGWGQRELANYLGVDRSTVTAWEGALHVQSGPPFDKPIGYVVGRQVCPVGTAAHTSCDVPKPGQKRSFGAALLGRAFNIHQ